MAKNNLRLGEILIKQGLLSQDALQKVIEEQHKTGGRLGEVIIKLKLCSEADIAKALGIQLNIFYARDLTALIRGAREHNLQNVVAEDFARLYNVVPLEKEDDTLKVAMFDPLDLLVIDNLKRLTGYGISPIVTTPSQMYAAMDELYGRKGTLQHAISTSYEKIDEAEGIEVKEAESEEINLDQVVASAEEAPVVRLVDLLIKQAIEDRASDIHIEPFPAKISLRYRIDGILYEIPPPAAHLLPPIISRIKILCKMNIAEKRLPQDGSFKVKLKDRDIDFRVSTIPTVYGEKMVLRVLDKSSLTVDLTQLGFNPRQLKDFETAIKSPYGIIFLTGPTGSGKTTTLYSALSKIKTPEKNIITVEDPVEYHLMGINQVQAKPEIGLTFAAGLRAFLRQDPDIIMVGEVRDLETAEIAIRAALTGHLVLSTLHTNDAPSSIGRLTNMGVEPFLLVSSLNLLAAQRLVRRLCPHCKVKAKVDAGIVKHLKTEKCDFYKAQGCDKCRRIGYLGRIAVYEVLPVTSEIKDLILKGVPPHEIKKKEREMGIYTLWDSGLEKAAEGLTSLEEVMATVLEREEME